LALGTVIHVEQTTQGNPNNERASVRFLTETLGTLPEVIKAQMIVMVPPMNDEQFAPFRKRSAWIDASFFPSSSATNPSLAIAAQSLRVAEHLCRALGGERSNLTDLSKAVRLCA
jgi:hypothetical protein